MRDVRRRAPRRRGRRRRRGCGVRHLVGARRVARPLARRADRLAGLRARRRRSRVPRRVPGARASRARGVATVAAAARRALRPALSDPHAAGPHPQLLDHRAHRPREVDAGRSHPRAHETRRRSARCASRCSTRWTSSASAGSRSRRRPSASTGRGHELNLIDTPGHVDFTYEVSRSLQACEGALLVVDAAQGIEAQTLANAYLAIENDLEIVPVVNKIDLPQADPDGAARELAELLGDSPDRVLRISAKTGQGIEEVLDAIVERIPSPAGRARGAPRARSSSTRRTTSTGASSRSCGSWTGSFDTRERLRAMAQGTVFEAEELGFMSPARRPVASLSAGEVGYVITGLKDVSRLRVGDTLTPKGSARRGAAARLQGREADGVRRALPDRLRRLPGAARRPREAQAQRRRRSRTSRRRRRRSGSGSAAGSSGCSTWRSCASGSSASSTSTCSSPLRTSRTGRGSGTETRGGAQPGRDAARARVGRGAVRQGLR